MFQWDRTSIIAIIVSAIFLYIDYHYWHLFQWDTASIIATIVAAIMCSINWNQYMYGEKEDAE